jgi:oligoribonuclease NrnB/cAMP/cGMP phosphodiesterase (DHH superfamily)
MNKPLCIYHGNCADGFTAAWAVWKRFGDTFDYHAGVYQQPPPDTVGRDVVLVDFSYKREVMLQLAKRANGVLVLDHHKSAAEDLWPDGGIIAAFGGKDSKYEGDPSWERFLENIGQDAFEGCPSGRIYTVFDMERSGAGIAWDFFHPGELRPLLVSYVEDRDLWRFKLPKSREVNAYVFAHAYDFKEWDYLNDQMSNARGYTPVAIQGEAIEKKHHKDVAELVGALKQYMTIGGFRVPVANLPYTLTSDAGHLMCKQPMDGVGDADWQAEYPPFAACYWDTPKGRVFSLRSVDGGADVSAIAASYGGGGHKNASGFTLPHGVEP